MSIVTNYLIGQPGSGKSTIMTRKLEALRATDTEVFRTAPYLTWSEFAKEKIIVLGKYDGRVFGGTDTWSKGAGPKFRDWLTVLHEDPAYNGFTVWGEGERLSNRPSLTHMIATCHTTIHLVSVPEEVLEQRQAERGPQNETWRKGMRTRIENLCDLFPVVPYVE
jgi:hypothetical protein